MVDSPLSCRNHRSLDRVSTVRSRQPTQHVVELLPQEDDNEQAFEMAFIENGSYIIYHYGERLPLTALVNFL